MRIGEPEDLRGAVRHRSHGDRTSCLKLWVEHELNGYPSGVELPSYRLHHTESFAHLRSPYLGNMLNAGVKATGLPDFVQDYIARPVRFTQGVAELESLIQGNQDMKQPWPTDLAHGFASNGYLDFEALSAWKIIPRAVVVGVRDAIRNRLLRFALELEEAAPIVETDGGFRAVPPGVVNQVFNTYIVGDNNQVQTTGAARVSVPEVAAGDDDGLMRALRDLGLSDDKAALLLKAAKEDPPRSGTGQLSARLKAALASMKDTAVEAGKAAAPELIVAVLKGYLGLS